MKLSGSVTRPADEISKRPVEGLACKRNEQSGKRFWTVVKEIYGEPASFFEQCFLHNICPLAFFDRSSGKNITPSELKAVYNKPLREICLRYLREIIELISPKKVVAIGRYVDECLKLKEFNLPAGIEVVYLKHPSPRSVNNSNWIQDTRTWWTKNIPSNYQNGCIYGRGSAIGTPSL